MKLSINKDFLTYKDEAIKGYSFMESLVIILATIGAIGTCVIMVYYFSTTVNTGIYTGMMGVASPILVLGFYKYQGMSFFELLKEMLYVERTKLLTREVDEYVSTSTFFNRKKTVEKVKKEKNKLYRLSVQKRR